MTFIEYETSEELASPAELYDFRIGSDSFKFTSNAFDVTVALGTFVADSLSRSPLRQEMSDRESDLDVEIPFDNNFVSTYEGTLSIPGKRATLTLYRTHLNDPDQETAVFFRGDVVNLSRSRDGRIVNAHVNSRMKQHLRQVPRRTYQGLCNHSVYDEFCTLSDTDPNFEKFLSVSSVSTDGLILNADTAGSFGNDFFVAGFAEFNSEFRMIVGQGGVGFNDLELLVPFQSDPLGQTVRFLAGCQHRALEDCDGKFGNIVNFGGHPFVPLKDIFRSGIN